MAAQLAVDTDTINLGTESWYAFVIKRFVIVILQIIYTNKIKFALNFAWRIPALINGWIHTMYKWQHAVYFAPIHDFLVQYRHFVLASLIEPYTHRWRIKLY